MPLTDTKLRSLKPAAGILKISDGGGLHIFVAPTGSKLWRMSYRFAGRQKTLSFGPYPATSLASARKRREEAKILLAEGIDPSRQARTAKQQRQTEARNSFAAIADEFLDKSARDGRAGVTIAKKRWLLEMAKGAFGSRPIRELSAADVLAPLRKVEAEGNLETARRLRAVTGQVFRYAISTARAEADPTYGLRGAIAAPRVIHRAALTRREDFVRLVRAVWSYEGQPETKIALKLMALLYPRPGELRLAEWPEFDLSRSVWTIPAERTKMRREHRKPLSPAAVAMLEHLGEFTGQRTLAFASALSPSRPISENTMNLALRRLGFSTTEATSHGFRASASSLLNECGLWSPDAIEAELGHATGDQVRRAYHRATYWDERVKMTSWWESEILRMVGEPAQPDS